MPRPHVIKISLMLSNLWKSYTPIALEEIDRRKWERAAKRFDEVERQHPYTVWARRSMLMAAFSYYQANQYPEAISAAEQFIALYPG